MVSCTKKYWPELEVGISNPNAPSGDKLRYYAIKKLIPTPSIDRFWY